MHKYSQGFTLLELVVVVVILGIVMAFAAPGLGDLIKNGRLSSDASDLVAAMQFAKTEAASRVNPVMLCERNDDATATVLVGGNGLNLPRATSSEGYYTLTAAACPTGTIRPCYLHTATAIGSQAADAGCATITYDSAGTKGGTTAECW